MKPPESGIMAQASVLTEHCITDEPGKGRSLIYRWISKHRTSSDAKNALNLFERNQQFHGAAPALGFV